MATSPNIIVNSLPKSGTHLLDKAVKILGGGSHEEARSILRRATDRFGVTAPANFERHGAGRWGRFRGYGLSETPTRKRTIPVGVFTPFYIGPRTFASWVRNRPLSRFSKAHLPYNPETQKVLEATNTRCVVILRDPRAVAASMIPYVLDARSWDHFLRPFFEELSEDERVDFVINGGYADPPGYHVQSLNDAFESVINWEQHSGSLLVRFEDLVGPEGGGNQEAQNRVFSELAAHLGVVMTQDHRARFQDVFDRSSPTFRGGRINGWRDRLTADQIARIAAALDPALMARAGYNIANGS